MTIARISKTSQKVQYFLQRKFSLLYPRFFNQFPFFFSSYQWLSSKLQRVLRKVLLLFLFFLLHYFHFLSWSQWLSQEFQRFLREILASFLFFIIFQYSHSLSWFQWLTSEIQKILKKISSSLFLLKEFSEFAERFYFFPLFLSLSSFRVFASSFLIPEITTSFRELETTINSITSRNARYYYGAILDQPAHRQTKTIRTRPIIVRTGLSLSLSLPFSLSPLGLGRSNSLGVATSSRPSVQLASCGVKLRFTASNPSFQVGSNDLSTSRLNKCTVNNHLYRMNTEGGERRGCDDRVLSNELDFQGARKR